MLEPGTQYSKSFLNNNRVMKTVNRQKISLVIDNIYLSEKQREERCKELLEKRGNGKYINEGIIARLFGEYLVDISENSKLSKDDITSLTRVMSKLNSDSKLQYLLGKANYLKMNEKHSFLVAEELLKLILNRMIKL